MQGECKGQQYSSIYKKKVRLVVSKSGYEIKSMSFNHPVTKVKIYVPAIPTETQPVSVDSLYSTSVA
jgi:hypothetical protein